MPVTSTPGRCAHPSSRSPKTCARTRRSTPPTGSASVKSTARAWRQEPWPASSVTGKLVDLESGEVSRRIYSDEAIYQQEIERIYARCWLFLGHESQIPETGDYITTSMCEDPVILWRDAGGRPRAYLNTCRHRGNRLCFY